MRKIINLMKRIGTLVKKYSSLYLSVMIPKNKKIMIFGSWLGDKYGDNPKYLYEYVVENRKDIKPIWITENKDVYDMLAKKEYPVMMANTWKSIWKVMRARYIFTCTGRRDIGKSNCDFIGNAYNINLWHGIPLKKIMYDNEYNVSMAKKEKITRFLEYIPLRKHFVVSTSDKITEIYTSAFRINETKILQLGQPRNDYFYVEHTNPYKKRFDGKKIILYMPTHRNEGKTVMDMNEILDLDKLNRLCEEKGYIFLIKKHFYHKNETTDQEKYSAVLDITSEIAEAQELLDAADILITDYSSCYIDYLLLNRPIIFYNYDIEQYQQNDRELYFDYNKVTPGNKCIDFNELYSELEQIVDREDKYIDKRKDICKLFYDESACESVSQKIIQTIEKL